MTMPEFHCPVCRNPLTWDVVFAHEGVREAMLALVDAHPDARNLLRPMLGYIGLFAPVKTTMRYERIASLAAELTGMIRTARVERGGQTHVAPVGYWQQAFEDIIARHHAGALRVPLGSHGYLLEIIIGYASKAEAASETKLEQQRAGQAGAGRNPGRPDPASTSGPVRLDAALTKGQMPEHVRQELGLAKKSPTTGATQ